MADTNLCSSSRISSNIFVHDGRIISSFHLLVTAELKWENDYSPIAAEPWPGALPTALAEPRSRFNATARYVLNAATSERTLESSLTVRDLTSRAHFSTIYSTFTFTHKDDTCHFSTCFFLSVWGVRALNTEL